jgi:CRISPR-associated protein Csx10
MTVIRYHLELIQPVLIPDPQGEANSAISLPYIPGSLVRGALIGLYRKSFDATDTDIRALFLGDTTRFLNAYPVREQQRALPLSAAFRYDKAEKPNGEKAQRTIYNFAHTPPDCQEEAVDAPFIWMREDGGLGDRFSPPRQVNVHTQRNPRKGRAVPRKGKAKGDDPTAGTVYRYDALAAGLLLQGMIFTEADEQLVSKLETVLQQHKTLWIGRARRAGYGEVRITVVEDQGLRENGSAQRPPAVRVSDGQDEPAQSLPELDLADSHEIPTEDVPDEPQYEENDSDDEATGYAQHLQLMLTSDALLRDEWGQATLNPSVAVAEAMGLPPSTFTLKSDSAFLTARVVGGFNRKWGLQLPQMLALAAGSTFDLETKESLSSEQLERLEQCGIGERRNEGFGQVLVRSGEQAEIRSERAELPVTITNPKLNETETTLAKTLAERLLQRKLDDRLRELVNRIELKDTPPSHQIARLRVLLREIERGRQPSQSIPDEQLERLANYLQSVQGRRAGEQLGRAKIDEAPKNNGGKATLPVWIKAQLLPKSEDFADDRHKDVFQAAQQRWSDLKVSFGATEKNPEGVLTVKVENEMAQEYSLRLVNQVLQRAAKLARTKAKERQNG